MGFASTKLFLINQVRGITPIRDTRALFVCHEDATGQVIPLESNPRMAQTRQFDLRTVGFPRDDGESGSTNRRMRVGLALRISYRLDGDMGYVQDMANEDVYKIVDTLVSAPTQAGWTAAGGISVGIPESPRVEILEPVEETSEEANLEHPLAAIVTIRFDVLYAE